MNAALAPSPWPAPADAAHRLTWLFGREVVVDGAAGAQRALQWLFKRNCSITPAQLAGVYAALCLVSFSVAGAFYFHGATFVLGFAGVELLALGAALLLYARHAGDRETLTLVAGSLRVEQCIGARVERLEFHAEWLRVEPAGGQGSLVELSGRGQRVRIGRFLRPELRSLLARELRAALRHALSRPTASLPASAAAGASAA